VATPPALRLIVTRYGGHCGFLDQLVGPTWMERKILIELGLDPDNTRAPPLKTVSLP
jgi:predicted alpha/beta-fold hydrolase